MVVVDRVELSFRRYQHRTLTVVLHYYMVLQGGIEPPSTDFQSAAKTTSATRAYGGQPRNRTENKRLQSSRFTVKLADHLLYLKNIYTT